MRLKVKLFLGALATLLLAHAPGAFDLALPLVIDPILEYSTYLGASGG